MTAKSFRKEVRILRFIMDNHGWIKKKMGAAPDWERVKKWHNLDSIYMVLSFIQGKKKATRNYEHYCKKFQTYWKEYKDMQEQKDDAISEWDKDIHYYNEDYDESMCDHYEDGLPAWKQLTKSYANSPLVLNHVYSGLSYLHISRAYFHIKQPQTSLF